jgi:hypothetical protein
MRQRQVEDRQPLKLIISAGYLDFDIEPKLVVKQYKKYYAKRKATDTQIFLIKENRFYFTIKELSKRYHVGIAIVRAILDRRSPYNDC